MGVRRESLAGEWRGGIRADDLGGGERGGETEGLCIGFRCKSLASRAGNRVGEIEVEVRTEEAEEREAI